MKSSKVTKICPSCQQPFKRFPSHAAKEVYCSIECAALGRFGPRPNDPNPLGLCMCGCGQTTSIAPKTHRPRGLLKGKHRKFKHGHQSVKNKGPVYLVNPSTQCWIWQRSVDSWGYGRIGSKLAHRVYFEAAFGSIPDGLQLHHTCGVRNCVNPDHLESITPTEHSILSNRKRWHG